MDKLYEKIEFTNNSTPALNASNLNAISEAIDAIDDRVIAGYANAQIAGTEATNCKNYATSAHEDALTASAAAESASSTVASVSSDLQYVIDKLDELLG